MLYSTVNNIFNKKKVIFFTYREIQLFLEIPLEYSTIRRDRQQ